ncbi:MAG: hypothetical protein Tsb0033_02460 [Winogradskyella sp.]
MDIYFTDEPTVTKTLELEGSPGINILTLFDDNSIPIAERLIFNYNGINIVTSEGSPAITQELDSVSIKLNFKSLDSMGTHNISVSVLPQQTQSYNRSHNIISYTFLDPYLNGPIENAKYYFTDITEKKKYELDNLLLTQGWSSYDWNTIFNNPPDINFDYEQGIILKANYVSSNTNESGLPNDLMYYFDDKGFLIAEADANGNSYTIKNLFPEEDQTIKLSEITSSKGIKPANLYTQFFPRDIPDFKTDFIREFKPTIEIETKPIYSSNVVFDNSEKVQKLDEVVVKSNPALIRREKENELSKGRFGKVNFITKEDENTFIMLWDYLDWKTQNWVNKTSGPNITTTGVAGTEKNGLNFFLNDVLLIEFSRLDELWLSDIEYIEFNRFGLGDGMRSPGGLIKIYTKDPTRVKPRRNTSKSYEFPLTFSKPKKFYAPKYKYYEDDFYSHYGVIDWKPNLRVDSNGQVSLKIEKPQVPITLFIEGITNDGMFIFEEKSISLN